MNTSLCELLRSLAIVAAFALWQASSTMAQPAPVDVEKAEFVFVGEVVNEKPPEAVARAKPGTASVRIDKVLKPAGQSAVSGYQGKVIAVRLRQAGSPARGEVATFYTRLLSASKTLEVLELAHDAAPAVATRDGQVAAASAEGERALAAQNLATLQRNVDAARVVIVGRVELVRPPPAAAAAGPQGRLSEHDPKWQEAVVAVSEVVKGQVASGSQRVTLRFPASRDVVWYDAPKLVPGQEGVFLLGPDGEILSRPVAAAGAAAPVVTGNENVLPINALPAVRQAVARRGRAR